MSQRKGKTIFSAVQPTGNITIGNYFGAVKNWVQLQSNFNCIFALADLHAITVRKEPEEFKQKTLEAYALLLACGINVEKSLFFIQSQVNTHCQLAWMLSCYTGFGELARMTQFKDKSSSHSDNVNCGLFSYPVLMLSVGGAYYGYYSSKERKLNKKVLKELKKSAKQKRKWDVYSWALENIFKLIEKGRWVNNDLLLAELNYGKDAPCAMTNFINVGAEVPKNVTAIFENLSTELSELINNTAKYHNKEEL